MPEVLDSAVIDEVVQVTGEQTVAAARRLARREGILGGISTGAKVHAALVAAARPGNAGRTIFARDPAALH